jgi:ADP-heptose:LPS heptosyltransferase
VGQIIIAPFAAKLRSGNRNPKNYPHFAELVARLNANSHEIIQIGVTGEDRIEGVEQHVLDWPFEKLKDLINDSDTWVSVDSWLPHFCHCYRLKPGIVLWGKSSPRIWGYDENENLWGGEHNLRPFQYKNWEEEEYDEKVFPSVMQIVWAVERRVTKPRHVGVS